MARPKALIIVRALRLPFLSASILPFVFGFLVARKIFVFWDFFLGLVSVGALHLSANLINDWADSRSGADWQDLSFYPFFGGSKLIQERVLGENFYFRWAAILAGFSLLATFWLALRLKSFLAVMIYLLIIFLGWSYSLKPLQFSYRRIGEVVIFLLFGPAIVMGGYYIASGVFPDLKGFLLSLPFGFLTCAILFANEVADYLEDRKAGKLTWVSITGPRYAFGLYFALESLAFLIIALDVALGYLKPWVLLCWFFVFFAVKATGIIKRNYQDKKSLLESSRLTISLQSGVSLILILVARL